MIHATNDISAIESRHCVDDFIEYMSQCMLKYDIVFSTDKSDRIEFVFGESWPYGIRHGTFCYISIASFEAIINRGQVGDGDTRHTHYEWSPSDTERAIFMVRRIDGFHFDSSELGLYNSYMNIEGTDKLFRYAAKFHTAVGYLIQASAYMKVGMAMNSVKEYSMRSAARQETEDIPLISSSLNKDSDPEPGKPELPPLAIDAKAFTGTGAERVNAIINKEMTEIAQAIRNKCKGFNVLYHFVGKDAREYIDTISHRLMSLGYIVVTFPSDVKFYKNDVLRIQW